LLAMIPPSLDAPAPRDIWEGLASVARFRMLGKRDIYRLFRWGPMAAADLVSEWFESEPLQAAIAARGIFGTMQGPWSAGTAALILLHAAVDPAPGGSSVTVKGGPGALTKAMAQAVEEAGGEIRLGQHVARVLVRDGCAAGVLLDDGSEMPTTTVVSNADPRRTFLELVSPIDLNPSFVARIRNYRSSGRMAKINLLLGELPVFSAVANRMDLCGRLHVGPSIDYLERAFDASKYGEMSSDPYLDVTLPTLSDPSLTPSDKHVMSICMQFVPAQFRDGREWTVAEGDLLSRVMATLETYAPGIGSLVEHAQVITPERLANEYAMTGGHIYHGEPSLDQLFMVRPVLGCARYRTPISGLFLCGAGTHPGAGITGGSGQNAAREILKGLR
jgi:phytoene dehydrogenase-like protein